MLGKFALTKIYCIIQSMINEDELKGQLYTIEEVAKMLKVGYFSIYLKVKSGVIEGHQVGRKWILTSKSVLDYLNRKNPKK